MKTIKKHAGIYTLHAEQKLPISLNDAWEFFSNPENLEKITPPSKYLKALQHWLVETLAI